mmetsp:Transcript_30749/g.39670  ORF Transcript_30749/g.39670 Transcript_30749/m.39670 type:complete len:97 (-) Transcript_30749:640-930(-)
MIMNLPAQLEPGIGGTSQLGTLKEGDTIVLTSKEDGDLYLYGGPCTEVAQFKKRGAADFVTQASQHKSSISLKNVLLIRKQDFERAGSFSKCHFSR